MSANQSIPLLVGQRHVPNDEWSELRRRSAPSKQVSRLGQSDDSPMPASMGIAHQFSPRSRPLALVCFRRRKACPSRSIAIQLTLPGSVEATLKCWSLCAYDAREVTRSSTGTGKTNDNGHRSPQVAPTPDNAAPGGVSTLE